MKTLPSFRRYEPRQLLLLPPDMAQWLPADHLVYFIRDVVGQMELSGIYNSYDGSQGGQPPYHPEMMVSLLIYAYSVGIPSSRQIEKATHESVPFRVLTADQHPDHDTISEFRRRHLKVLASLFLDVLRLCRKAGLVKLGHVSLDGTKMHANASKHKAMSYGRMKKAELELEEEVERLLKKADATDQEEDQRYGKGRRGDELPEELRFKESRLAKIREAKEALEQETRKEAQQKRVEQESKNNDRDPRGRPPKVPTEEPDPKSQRNFTDPDSRIMKDGATKAFEQCYNCQTAVDGSSQVIVATGVTHQTNDKRQLQPLLDTVKRNLHKKPKQITADSGYYSEDNISYLDAEAIDGYVATGRFKHTSKPVPCPRGRIPQWATVKERMARKLKTARGRRVYGKRKGIVEPVFGQIKQVRKFRQFLLRGIEKVASEWDLICLGHNLLKLFRSGWSPARG
jgi:transposase